ncbi:hypothetical protein MMC26_003986 [Xylographa opegraphella]|nr:hypothetical protein [Xylographa opegraphella]
MNEISARCGCKFTFCGNKGALVRWADGSKQNVWRNSANPRAENTWGKRHPPETPAEDIAGPSSYVVPKARAARRSKRKASTEILPEPEATATTSLGELPTGNPHVRHRDEVGPQATAPANLNLTPQEGFPVYQGLQQGYVDPQMLMGPNLDMTLTQDPLFGAGNESSEELYRERVGNDTGFDDTYEGSALIGAWDDAYFDDWMAENPRDPDFADHDVADPDIADPDTRDPMPYLREVESDEEREVTGRRRRRRDRGSRWRRWSAFQNRPSNSDEAVVVEEASEDEERITTRTTLQLSAMDIIRSAVTHGDPHGNPISVLKATVPSDLWNLTCLIRILPKHGHPVLKKRWPNLTNGSLVNDGFSN